MEAWLNRIRKMQKLDYREIVRAALSDRKTQRWILDTIRWRQLYDEGIRGDGLSLGEYSALSLVLKKDPQVDHITLHETGEFYDTFTITLKREHFIVDGEASTKVDDQGRDLFDRYDNLDGDLLGLTDDHLEELIELIKPALIKAIWESTGL